MAQLGWLMIVFGGGSFLLNLLNYEFRLLFWIDNWGTATGNAIRIGLIVVGALLLVLGSIRRREAAVVGGPHGVVTAAGHVHVDPAQPQWGTAPAGQPVAQWGTAPAGQPVAQWGDTAQGQPSTPWGAGPQDQAPWGTTPPPADQPWGGPPPQG